MEGWSCTNGKVVRDRPFTIRNMSTNSRTTPQVVARFIALGVPLILSRLPRATAEDGPVQDEAFQPPSTAPLESSYSFVGMKKCRMCHTDQYDSLQASDGLIGGMGRSHAPLESSGTRDRVAGNDQIEV